MICSNCNSTQDSNAIVCTNCGTSLPETNIVTNSPKKGVPKALLLIPVIIIALIGGGCFYYFTRPTLGPVLLNTKTQLDQEIATAKTNNPMATDLKNTFAGNYTAEFNLDKYIATSELAEYKFANTYVVLDDTDQVVNVSLKTDAGSQKGVSINFMKGTSTAYRTLPTKYSDSFSTLKGDLYNLIADKIDVKGKKSKDENYDTEFTFDMNYGDFLTAFDTFLNTQNTLSNEIFTSYDLTFQPLEMSSIDKLASGVFGSDYNFFAKLYVKGVVNEYNSNLTNLNAETKTSINEAISTSNAEFDSAMKIFTQNFDKDSTVKIIMKSKDGLLKSIVMQSGSEQLILEISDPSSYLNSSYKLYLDGGSQGEMNVDIISTPDNWAYSIVVDDNDLMGGYTMAFDWKFKETTDNFKLKTVINDGPAEENVDTTLSLSGDAQNGFTVSDGNFVNAVIKSK